jgi:release factor glutamine methyltransferase
MTVSDALAKGRTTFMGLELAVVPGVLVPRAETELLARTALSLLGGMNTDAPRVIDMCTGAGNLACAIASHVTRASVWCSDLTDNCVEVARANVLQLGLADRIVVAQGDLFAGLEGVGLEDSIDLIVCNPPYVSQKRLLDGDRTSLLVEEPREAFDGGPYGLSIHQRVMKEALPFLRAGSALAFEFGLGQDRQVRMLFERTGAFENLHCVANESGEARVIHGRKHMSPGA